MDRPRSETRCAPMGAVTAMTATPPEPDFSLYGTPGPPPPSTYAPPPPPPPAFPPPPQPSAQDLAGPRRPRMGPLRIITGVLWAAVAIICAVGTVLEFSVGIPGGAVVCLIVAVGAGWYDYRVWTFKARRFLL
jgi:hypothetical protein